MASTGSLDGFTDFPLNRQRLFDKCSFVLVADCGRCEIKSFKNPIVLIFF